MSVHSTRALVKGWEQDIAALLLSFSTEHARNMQVLNANPELDVTPELCSGMSVLPACTILLER